MTGYAQGEGRNTESRMRLIHNGSASHVIHKHRLSVYIYRASPAFPAPGPAALRGRVAWHSRAGRG